MSIFFYKCTLGTTNNTLSKQKIMLINGKLLYKTYKILVKQYKILV